MLVKIIIPLFLSLMVYLEIFSWMKSIAYGFLSLLMKGNR
jgi:hypothetical protein